VISLNTLLAPIEALVPESLRIPGLIAILALLLLSFAVGVAVRTGPGQKASLALERNVLSKIPGFTIFQSVTKRLAGKEGNDDTAWQPALVETDDNALMPAFIIEILDDGRYTVFVPSVPTPFAGAVFVYQKERVHPVNVPFSQAVRVVSHWGEGTKDLVAAM